MSAVPLSAGPLRLDYDAGDLRCIRLGGLEIVRRIYVAFQDRNWTARPWVIEDEEIESDRDSFRISLRARGTFDASPFAWTGSLSGDANGTIHYAIDGTTDSPFLRNRLGICLLHPIADFAGRPCTITTVAGETLESEFPDDITPHQPFLGIRCMDFPAGDGVRARLDFAGETFETEDHRNWSDASYKTYCTPISLPFPVEVRPGERVAQSVTLTLEGQAPPPVDVSTGVSITVSADAVPLPSLGTQIDGLPWTDAEVDAIGALGLDHLMATIEVTATDAHRQVAAASDIAARTGTRLRLRLSGGDRSHYEALRDVVRSAPLESIAVLRTDEKVTSTASLALAREELGVDLPWCGGTDLYFTELNRQPPDTDGLTWVSFSLNPQVHAFDDRTVLQNTAAQEVIARNAPRLAGAARIAVGPITLRPRFNPNATDPSADVSNTDLPTSVDARQRTWFAAAWTALSLRGLAVAGTVSAATYFEALGWRGLRERDSGSADPEAFPSSASEEFPVYDFLRNLRGYPRLLPTQSDQPEVADAVVVESAAGVRAFVANLSPLQVTVVLNGPVSATIDAAPESITVVDVDRSSP